MPPCDWEFKSKITIAILYSKITVFEAMNMRYEITHNIRARREPYKEQIKTFFIHTVMASDSYTKFADVFMFKVGHELFTEACRLTTVEITKTILHQYHFSKELLMIEMLTALANGGDFNGFMKYIKDANVFAMEYIEKMVDEYSFENHQFTQIAARHLDCLMELVEDGIKTAHDLIVEGRGGIVTNISKEEERGDIDPNISKEGGQGDDIDPNIAKEDERDSGKDPTIAKEELWCNTFCEAVAKKLPNINKAYFDMLKDCDIDISDFEQMKQLLSKYLQKFVSETKQKFKKMNAESVHWEGLTPSVFLFERLWGCTTVCSFCGEPCKKTRANHKDPHECLQHRPICFHSGEYKKTTENRELMCNFAVANDYIFTCRNAKCPERKKNKDKA